MKDGREDGRKNAEKILRGAQAARLRFLFAALFTAALFCFLCGLASALFFRNVGGRVAAAALFCLFAGLSGWAGYFLCIYAAIRKNADSYAFAVTESASFECFGPFLAMDYDLRIYSENGKYFAEVEIDGQTTWIHVLAQVYGNEEGIDLMYLEGVEEAPFPHIEMEPGTVLLSLREEDGLIYTYWGAITAYIYDSNQRSGKVYFTKMEEAEIDPSDGKALSVMGASLEIPCWRLEELRMNDSGLLSRWSQDEVDTVLNALEGYWMADEYAGFVLPEFYFTHLAETDGLSDEKRMQVYEEKIDEAKNHIPEWHFSIRQNNTGENTVKNCVYIDGQEEQEIDLFLCMSREEDSYPEYVDRTAVSGEVDIVYPVLYMEFRVPEDGVEKQVNLIITADNRLYLLFEGAFYTVKELYG